VSGYTLGQEYGHGRTFQHTVVAGVDRTAPAPVAGQSYSYSVGPWDRMRLVFVVFTLTTDANAANRYVTIEYPGINGVSVIADGASVTVSANTTAQRFVGALRRGPAEWNTNTDVFFPLSGFWAPVGQTITINIANVQAGDLLSKVALTFDATPVHGDGSELARAVGIEREVDEIAAAIAAAAQAG
jgi:hypothetical protein